MKPKTAVALILVIAAAAALAFSPLRMAQLANLLSDVVAGSGLLGIALFALVYVLLVVVLAPAEILTIAAGFLYGPLGFAIVLVPANVGAMLAFAIARCFLQGRARTLFRKHPLLAAIDGAIAAEGWRIVLLTRLNPLVPFGLQNYFFGTTSVRPLAYALATFFGIMPGAAMYIYIGTLGRLAARDSVGLPKLALLTVGLLATAAMIWVIARKTSRMLEAMRSESAPGSRQTLSAQAYSAAPRRGDAPHA
jgi:uncharacterized membrane protein YdjX (TVP38/TMEM64 family)